MKKIISLILTLLLILPTAVFAADSNELSDPVEALTALNIIIGNESGDLMLGKGVTRAEFSTIVVRILGLSTTENKLVFTDVPLSHWANSAINSCYNLGIINGYGDGRFGPEDEITYEQAIKMITILMGYEPMAQTKGGYPSGYLAVAAQTKITNDVNSAMTRGDVIQLIYNAIQSPKMLQTSFGSQEEFTIMNGKNGNDYVSILTDNDIYIITGEVGEKFDDTIEITATEDSDDLEFIMDEEYSFNIGVSNIKDYNHQTVKAFVKKDKKEYTILFALSAEENTLTVNGDKLYLEDGKLYYEKSQNKDILIKFEDSVKYIYNTKEIDSVDFTALEDAILKFVDTDNNNKYNTVIITEYYEARVGSVAPAKNKINIDGKTIELDFEDLSKDILLKDAAGNQLTLEDFSEDDIVAVVCDSKTLKDYNYIEIILLKDSYISGVVEEIKDSTNEVCINGEFYKNTSSYNLVLGDEGTFYLGITGNIIDFDKVSSAATDYAYVLDVAKSTESFSKDNWKIKVLTVNGIKILTANEKLTDSIDASLIKNVITYKLNSKGEIRSFEKQIGTAVDGKYKAETQVLNSKILEDDILIFDATAADINKSKVIGISSLVDDGEYKGYLYKNNDEYEVFVMTAGESALTLDSGVAIVTNITKVSNETYSDYYKISYVQNEEEGVTYLHEDCTTEGTIEYTDIKIGDMILFNADEYLVIATIKNGIPTIVEDISDEDIKLYQGYIANNKRITNSKGELLEIKDGDTFCITSIANKYTYDNSNSKRIKIITEDIFGGDADYSFDKEYTPIILIEKDGSIIDAYTSSERVIID